MSNTNEIIADIIGEASYVNCPECGHYNLDACGYSSDENGNFYIHYCCEECYLNMRFRWIPKSDDLVDDFNECHDSLTLSFRRIRLHILRTKGKKFNIIKALLDYYEVCYEETITIPEIYSDLKKNYVDHRNYKLYKLLLDCPVTIAS